ncbi:unnamed protein product, partial [Mesorhabditis belari]|uniref:Uncharacterized protein n=1 Tax=Mesorhabditis belari TaxID=2138241 RepID=A0AAF3ET80_9BILA
MLSEDLIRAWVAQQCHCKTQRSFGSFLDRSAKVKRHKKVAEIFGDRISASLTHPEQAPRGLATPSLNARIGCKALSTQFVYLCIRLLIGKTVEVLLRSGRRAALYWEPREWRPSSFALLRGNSARHLGTTVSTTTRRVAAFVSAEASSVSLNQRSAYSAKCVSVIVGTRREPGSKSGAISENRCISSAYQSRRWTKPQTRRELWFLCKMLPNSRGRNYRLKAPVAVSSRRWRSHSSSRAKPGELTLNHGEKDVVDLVLNRNRKQRARPEVPMHAKEQRSETYFCETTTANVDWLVEVKTNGKSECCRAISAKSVMKA